MSVIWRLRAAVLTLAGVLGVHEARYLFAPPEHAHALAGVHTYLAWLTPMAGVLLFLSVVHLAARLAGRGDDGAARLPRARTLWLSASATLVAVFAAQESLEILLAHGHVPGPAELAAGGGWTVVPFAALAGAVIALLLRGAATVVRWALRRARRVGRPSLVVAAPSTPVLAPRGSVLARRLAGRAPPALS